MSRGAKKTWYNGTEYDSGTEARYAENLDRRLAAGEILSWRGSVNFLLIDAYSLDGERVAAIFYETDFVVEMPPIPAPTGPSPLPRWEIVEAKGRWEEDAKLKWKLFGWLWSREPGHNLLSRAGISSPDAVVRLVLHQPATPKKPRKGKKTPDASAMLAIPEAPEPPKSMTSAEYRRKLAGGWTPR